MRPLYIISDKGQNYYSNNMNLQAFLKKENLELNAHTIDFHGEEITDVVRIAICNNPRLVVVDISNKKHEEQRVELTSLLDYHKTNYLIHHPKPNKTKKKKDDKKNLTDHEYLVKEIEHKLAYSK